MVNYNKTGKTNPIPTVVILALVFSAAYFGPWAFLILVVVGVVAAVGYVAFKKQRHEEEDCSVSHASMYTDEEIAHMHAVQKQGGATIADDYSYRVDELKDLMRAGIIDNREYAERLHNLQAEFRPKR